LFPLARPESSSATADMLRVRSGLRVLVDQRYVPRRAMRTGAARTGSRRTGTDRAGDVRQRKIG
jgi:hypothetical protein